MEDDRWQKLQRFLRKNEGLRQNRPGAPSTSAIEPFREEVVYLHNQGHSLGVIANFLEEECGLKISRGAIDGFLRSRGVK
jgi:hypothetical protein